MNKANVMIIISSCKKIIDIFLGPFLIAYFIKTSVDSVVDLSIFKILNYFCLGILSMFAGFLMEKNHALATFRLGIFSKFIYILLIIVLNENVVNHLGLISIFYGLSTATFYLPFNRFNTNSVENKERSLFETKKLAVTSIINILVPVCLGTMITVTNYILTAVIILFISLIEFICSFYVVQLPVKQRKYDILKTMKKFMKNKQLKKWFLVEFIIGLVISDAALGVLITILIINSFETDMNLGIINSITAIMTLIITFLYSKYYQGKDDKKVIIISSILPAISVIFLLLYTSNTTLVIYNFFFNVLAVGLLNMIHGVRLSNLSIKEVVDEDSNEFWVLREQFLNIGRIIGFILMLIIGMLGMVYLNYLLVFFSLLLIVYGLLLTQINKNEE